jgi:hypothetical protein
MAPNSRLSHYLVFKDQAVVRLKIDRDGKKKLFNSKPFPRQALFQLSHSTRFSGESLYVSKSVFIVKHFSKKVTCGIYVGTVCQQEEVADFVNTMFVFRYVLSYLEKSSR